MSLGFMHISSLYVPLPVQYNYLVRSYIDPQPVSPRPISLSAPFLWIIWAFGLWQFCSPSYDQHLITTWKRRLEICQVKGSLSHSSRSTLQLLTGLPIAMWMLFACVIDNIIFACHSAVPSQYFQILYFSCWLATNQMASHKHVPSHSAVSNVTPQPKHMHN